MSDDHGTAARQGGRPDAIARGWDEAADGYEAYFVPRFAPWVTDAVRALAVGVLPDGPVLVPCCGTFPELGALVARLPGREIIGIDLSAGMLHRARRRAARRAAVRLIRGDASTLDAWTGRCAAVLSVFGLQQLPDPERAIGSWAAALRPGGRLSVVFWPDTTERDGPFALIDDAVSAHRAPGHACWEDRVVAALRAQGAVIEADTRPAHPISHPSASAFFHAYTNHGPLRALVQAQGDASVAGLRDRFLQRAPTGEWRHRPRARLIVAHRRRRVAMPPSAEAATAVPATARAAASR